MRAAVFALVLGGCLELAPPHAERVAGDGRVPARVLAMPMTCGTLSELGSVQGRREVCVPELLATPKELVRAELELRGISIVDAERVNAERRARRETRDSVEIAGVTTTSSELTVSGARFEDAPPQLQAELARDLGVDGVLTARVWIGSGSAHVRRRTVRVQLRLRRIDSGAVVWASRCDLEVDGRTVDDVAVERATICALRKATS